jgi:hypothetical protein
VMEQLQGFMRANGVDARRVFHACDLDGSGHGFTLVHCSAQPEPFLSLNPANMSANSAHYVKPKGGRVSGPGGWWLELGELREMMRTLGKAVQVDPIKPTLKAPETKRLKLKYDEPLSNFAFNFNLRRFSWCRARGPRRCATCSPACATWQGGCLHGHFDPAEMDSGFGRIR